MSDVGEAPSDGIVKGPDDGVRESRHGEASGHNSGKSTNM